MSIVVIHCNEVSSRIAIDPASKEWIMRFQSLLQAKTGKFISQGKAALVGCKVGYILLDFVDGCLPIFMAFAEKGDNTAKTMLKTFEMIRNLYISQAEAASEGELKDYDLEEWVRFLLSRLGESK